jgi:hypothetical protein
MESAKEPPTQGDAMERQAERLPAGLDHRP